MHFALALAHNICTLDDDEMVMNITITPGKSVPAQMKKQTLTIAELQQSGSMNLKTYPTQPSGMKLLKYFSESQNTTDTIASIDLL